VLQIDIRKLCHFLSLEKPDKVFDVGYVALDCVGRVAQASLQLVGVFEYFSFLLHISEIRASFAPTLVRTLRKRVKLQAGESHLSLTQSKTSFGCNHRDGGSLVAQRIQGS
jgi:hypothetical protein